MMTVFCLWFMGNPVMMVDKLRWYPCRNAAASLNTIIPRFTRKIAATKMNMWQHF